MKLCPQCEKENPSSANHCMYCGTELVEEAQLSEEAKLLKKIKKLEEENELKTKILEKQLEEEDAPTAKTPEKQETPPPIVEKIQTPTYNTPKNNNKKSIGLLITLAAVALIVFGVFYYFSIYLPAKIDREAPRYYTFADVTNLRASKMAGADYNKVGSLNYGSELITYYHDSEWSEVKDAAGNKGFISSNLLLSNSDFVILNNIFGDTESKQNINTTKCRLALLNYYKENNLGSEWRVFCRPKETKPNAVFYPRLYNKNSKFTDFAVIIKNTLTNKRKILIFGFNDDESVAWKSDGDAADDGYIKNITQNNGQIYVDYSN
ncbi:MAG: hypothetical protein LBN11_00520 [Tannerella sp.]|jgi:hypothetical protein|nr:hypothetical protein [Tannerella sp.]